MISSSVAPAISARTSSAVSISTAATASRRQPVSACSGLSRSVLLALCLRVERIDLRLHGRVREMLAAILRNHHATSGEEEQNDCPPWIHDVFGEPSCYCRV